jgi:hypothetical protein
MAAAKSACWLKLSAISLLLAGCATPVERLRGYRFIEPPKVQVISRAEWVARVRDREKAWRATEECAAYDALWKSLGIVGGDADSQHWVYEIMARYYKFPYEPSEKKIYVIADAVTVPTPSNFLVHEHIHVLQHQHSMLYGPTETDDMAWAYSAVAEGEALLYELSWPHGDFSKVDLEAYRRTLPTDVPAFALRWAYFPHFAGARYVKTRGKDVWKHLPLSTEQVLHPDRTDPPMIVTAPKLHVGKLVVQTVLGEWTVADWYWALTRPPEGVEFLAGGLPNELRWGGDLAQVYRKDDGEWFVAVYLYWDDEASAERFAQRVKNASGRGRWVVVMPDAALRDGAFDALRVDSFRIDEKGSK